MFGSQSGDPEPALAVLFECPLRRHQAVLVRAEAGDAERFGLERRGIWLAGILLEGRLRIEEIDVARSALHEAEDHRLRARRHVRRLRVERIDRCVGVLVEHARERDCSEAAARLCEELAPAGNAPMMFELIHWILPISHAGQRTRPTATRALKAGPKGPALR